MCLLAAECIGLLQSKELSEVTQAGGQVCRQAGEASVLLTMLQCKERNPRLDRCLFEGRVKKLI